MDYTKDDKLMEILSELAHEVGGWEYTLNSHWRSNEAVIADRRKTLNEAVDKFTRHINAK